MISFNQVWAGYNQSSVLRDLSFSVDPGEFVVFIGPNGSGKSTLLKTILGLVSVRKGRLTVFNHQGTRISKVREKIGYLPQNTAVPSNYPATAFDVVLMGSYSKLGFFKRPGNQEKEEALSRLEEVGLAAVASTPFGILSGGQRQRVLLARALMGSPTLLLLDEPTTALDVSAQRELIDLVSSLVSQKGITVIMVTHDVNLIYEHADKIGYLKGELKAYGSPDAILDAKLLSEIYETQVLVFEHEGKKQVVVGDYHA